MEHRILNDDQCRGVYTLNTWTEIKKEEASKYLEAGYYVHFGSYAIGHTMAQIVENDGIKWAKEKYGERIEIIIRDGWGYAYVHLINPIQK